MDVGITSRTAFRLTSESEFSTAVEVCIFLMNKTAVTFELEDPNFITTEVLTELLLSEEEVGLPLDSTPIFSLWFTSSYLEVQLKPYHTPYKIRQQWSDLLQKYTTVEPQKLFTDEPILCLQRNVFYSRREEMRIQNKTVIEMLYEEAKTNVMEGRYPCEEASYYMLAGLQARIELGRYNSEIHTLDFFRARLKKFLPPHMCSSRLVSLIRRGLNFKSGPESRILEHFRNLASETGPESLHRKYLEFCWTLPYYGSAYFRGQIENPSGGLRFLLSFGDRPVVIAINGEGLYLICQYENIVLLGLRYEEFCWGFTKPKNPLNPDCFPCLYVQFQATERAKKVLKVLQIFSKQAVMMDALICYFVEELRKKKLACGILPADGSLLFTGQMDADELDMGTPSSSSPVFSDALVPLTKATISRRQSAESFICNKLNRLSLATFNEEGDCIGQMGSWTISN